MRDILAHVLIRVDEVRRNLGAEIDHPARPDDRFADLLDSMGLVEFLLLLADDLGVTPEVIEQSVGGHFGTIQQLAIVLSAGIGTQSCDSPSAGSRQPLTLFEGEEANAESEPTATWLAATATRLPATIESAEALNRALNRPPGWLERHAGILQRRIWGEGDAVTEAANAARACLDEAHLEIDEVGTLLVTSEAPPMLAGLAAAIHHRLGLEQTAAAIEVGNACSGFLNALWLAESLVAKVGAVLIVAVEAPSRYLRVEPGPAGEAAALFGDAAAACLLCEHPMGERPLRLEEVVVGVEGGAGHVLQVNRSQSGTVEVQMDGKSLTNRAVKAMAQGVRDVARLHGLTPDALAAVVVHGGNGRMPALLARQLDLPAERVWSETGMTGNLGSASVPVAWAARKREASGPVVWTSAGAGLTWAAALFGAGEEPTADDGSSGRSR